MGSDITGMDDDTDLILTASDKDINARRYEFWKLVEADPVQAVSLAAVEICALFGVRPTRKFIIESMDSLAPFLDGMVAEAEKRGGWHQE